MAAGKLRVTLVLAILLSMATVACVRRAPLVNYENEAIVTASQKPKTLEDIGKAIAVAAVLKNWTLSEVRPGHATAKLVVRGKHTVVVDITYTEKSLSINYKSSVDMNYERGQDNIQYIHPRYNAWVANLLKAINRELVR